MAVFKCCFCGKKYVMPEALYAHMEEEHKISMEGLPAEQVYFNYRNRYPLTKRYGKSVISGKPTAFNMKTGRYERFSDEKEKEKYRNYFVSNMKRVYGKETILDEPEQQKKMLANRHISGKYQWSDGIHEFTYTGSYERRFLEFLDLELNWDNPEDIFAPAPMIFNYTHPDGTTHFHIPDFYIGSLNTIISIKSTENMHYRLRDIEIERAQDEAIKKSKFDYIKIVDNRFDDFIDFLERKKAEGVK